MRRPKDKLIAGMDLHSNNVLIGIINQDGKRLAHRKVNCNLAEVIAFLKPLKAQLQSMAVESTFNWYWLIDGLREASYPIDLANPAKIEQYSGLKHADDKDDAFFLAELQRLADQLPSAVEQHVQTILTTVPETNGELPRDLRHHLLARLAERHQEFQREKTGKGRGAVPFNPENAVTEGTK